MTVHTQAELDLANHANQYLVAADIGKILFVQFMAESYGLLPEGEKHWRDTLIGIPKLFTPGYRQMAQIAKTKTLLSSTEVDDPTHMVLTRLGLYAPAGHYALACFEQKQPDTDRLQALKAVDFDRHMDTIRNTATMLVVQLEPPMSQPAYMRWKHDIDTMTQALAEVGERTAMWVEELDPLPEPNPRMQDVQLP